jgi:hypothetical protein
MGMQILGSLSHALRLVAGYVKVDWAVLKIRIYARRSALRIPIRISDIVSELIINNLIFVGQFFGRLRIVASKPALL